MQDILLTNEADFMLCTLYNAYLEKRKADMPRQKAVRFKNPDSIQEEFLPQWSTDDIIDIAWELSRNNLVSCRKGDAGFTLLMLTTDAIVYMENRFENNMDKLLQRIAAIKSILLR